MHRTVEVLSEMSTSPRLSSMSKFIAIYREGQRAILEGAIQALEDIVSEGGD
jgi:hypothetical protein